MNENLYINMEFEKEKKENIACMNEDENVKKAADEFMREAVKHKYVYNSTWLGRPIIQFPQDIVALQEVIFSVKPDLIIETGIAHGGSIIFSASMMELLDIIEPVDVKREVVGVDIEIRKHNRVAIENHPMYRKITMIEGSSVDSEIIQQVKRIAHNHKKIMVILDSNHSHEHVLKELQLYGELVSVGSYIAAFDTDIEFVEGDYSNRPWGKGNNPYTAVQEYMKDNAEFEVDYTMENKMLITSCYGGWLKKLK